MAETMSGPRKTKDTEVARTLQVDEGDSLRDRALAAAVSVRRRPILVVVMGDDVGKRARVGGSSFTVGRSQISDFVVDDPRISSRHFRIEDRGDGWALIDLGSTNGTKVNGEREADRLLVPNDKIEAGDTVFRFELQDAADEAYDALVHRMMHIDDLTGLYLRRRFDQELEDILRGIRAESGSLGMLVMDLDGLKAINDAHGHLFGAYVIAESGKLIGRTIPPNGIAARFGGDEYVAACPGFDLLATAGVADQILMAVRGHGFEKDGIALHPGISIGIAAYPDHGEDGTSLFRTADAALYAAKRAGKDRVSRPPR